MKNEQFFIDRHRWRSRDDKNTYHWWGWIYLVKKYHKGNKITVVDDLSMGKKQSIEGLDNVTFYKYSVLDK